ncbi:MAG TPA: HAMP domain-containing histidine kinase [Sedimenticola sp.]|nr:HAMP domain-containing histidine kinase [Sedimenticola sp.]
MRFKTDLTQRAAIAFSLVGALVSLILAAGIYVLTLNMEERLIAEALALELKDYMARYGDDPDAPPPSGASIRAYVFDPGRPTLMPPGLQRLEPGLHQVRLGEQGHFAAVRIDRGIRFVLLLKDTQVRRREQQFLIFLAGAVLLMTLFSAMLGSWLAGRVVSPVRELARRVSRLSPDDSSVRLAVDFPRDEVGALARDFDAYRQRLQEFIEREQAFAADVSHELRTPLTVISGAAEVLLSDPGLDEESRGRVRRVARAAREMSELVSALLVLAREGEAEGTAQGGCAVDEILNEVLDSHRHFLRLGRVELETDIKPGVSLPVQCTLLRVVLSNLVRNAFLYTENGRVRISLDERGVTVEDTGPGIRGDQLARVFERYYRGGAGTGEGIGLSLVKRICQHWGWRIDIDSREGRGTRVRLLFAAGT